MAELISITLSQQPSDKPAFRLKIYHVLKLITLIPGVFCFWCHCELCSSSHFSLFNLYNLLENPYSRFFVYMKALNLAINGKVVEHILSSFKKIDSFLKEWNLGVKDHMGLFFKISNIMKKTKGSAKESFKFLIQYLGTFLDEDASAINEKEEALHAIIAFVKAPDMFQIDDIEVESWVVKAISAMLLSCKIDQMNQVITMRECKEHVFGTNQWQLLRAKLVTWKGNISGVIRTIYANKIVEDSIRTMQGLAIR